MRQAIKQLRNPKATSLRQSHTCYHEQLWQERELAFFFLDIRDFTPLIASRPALEVLHLLQQLFKLFQRAIAAHGGTIIETAGDGLYAVFGFEEPLQQATSSAVEAGFSILQKLDQANQTCFGPFFHHCFQVGIGLHVGSGIAGQMGLGVNNNMTVMGYAVNLAARLQQATKLLNNNFIISAEAYRLLAHPPTATSNEIVLKGIQAKMKVYLLGGSYASTTCEEADWKVAC